MIFDFCNSSEKQQQSWGEITKSQWSSLSYGFTRLYKVLLPLRATNTALMYQICNKNNKALLAPHSIWISCLWFHLSCNSRVIRPKTDHMDLSIYMSYMVDGIPDIHYMGYTLHQIWSMEYHTSPARTTPSTRYAQWIPNLHCVEYAINQIWSMNNQPSLCRSHWSPFH